MNYFPEYRGRELEFAQEILGERYWKAQRTIFEGLFRHHREAVRTSHGIGKTRIAAGIATTFLCTRKDAIVVSTAPTDHQVRNLLWGEIGVLHARASALGNDLPGEPDQKQWRLGPKWYALGLATNKPGRFQGFHGSVTAPEDPDEDIDLEEYEKNVSSIVGEIEEAADAPGGILLIFDEAAWIDQAIYDAAKGALTSPDSYVLEIGNPDIDLATSHEFVRVHQPGSDFFRVRVSCEPGPPDPLEPAADSEDMRNGMFVSFDHVPNWILRPEWVEERKRDYGVGTPLYYSKIWGQFAGSDASSRLMTNELLTACLEAPCDGDLGVHMGVDIAAGEAGDENVAALLVNGRVRAMHGWRPRIGENAPLMAVITVIEALRITWGGAVAKEYGWGDADEFLPWDHVHIEKNGVGAGVCDRLRQQGKWIDRVDMGAPAKYDWRDITGEVRFLNRRAELYWLARRLAEEKLFSLDPAYEDAWAQAQWTTFSHHEQSKGTTLKMLDKKLIRKQYGRSPDHWDSIVLAFSRASGRLQFATR